MFSKKAKRDLDQQIDRAVGDLRNHVLGSENYIVSLNMVTELTKLKNEQSSAVSKDTMAVVGGNLLGIFMIIKHEAVNVVTSRAMSLLLKPR